MSTSTIAPAPVKAAFDDVCDALRDVHDEASLWRLSDELVKIAPSGVQSVEDVVTQAKARGIPTKSTNTLRLYRDVAIRFPANERVPLVSFSAHREAIAIGDVAKARKVLQELAAKHGPDGVTVTTVKKAIGAATGKVSATPSPKAKGTSYDDIAVDLSTGAKKFLGELDAMLGVQGVTLDGFHAGLSAVLAKVEDKRAKAARRKVTPKAAPAVDPSKSRAARHAREAASKAASKPSPNGAARKRSVKAGDLRGL